MDRYYVDKLSAERLRRCYELAPPRVRQYLEAELQHALTRIRPSDRVLELGCGYGRLLERIAPRARFVVGIDTSPASLRLAGELLLQAPHCRLAAMNAATLGFRDGVFDVVLCLQNGVSAFKVDPRALVLECLRVTRPGGRVLLSSYAERFWPDRLEWFRLQSEHGLLGEIDWDATGAGVIVCKDGFRATTVGPDEFRALTAGLPAAIHVGEVDESSVFCELAVRC